MILFKELKACLNTALKSKCTKCPYLTIIDNCPPQQDKRDINYNALLGGNISWYRIFKTGRALLHHIYTTSAIKRAMTVLTLAMVIDK